MGIRIRFSHPTLAILDALLAHPAQWHHGYAMSLQTNIPSGTLYPILMRLDKRDGLKHAGKTLFRKAVLRGISIVSPPTAATGPARNCALCSSANSASPPRVRRDHDFATTVTALLARACLPTARSSTLAQGIA